MCTVYVVLVLGREKIAAMVDKQFDLASQCGLNNHAGKKPLISFPRNIICVYTLKDYRNIGKHGKTADSTNSIHKER